MGRPDRTRPIRGSQVMNDRRRVWKGAQSTIANRGIGIAFLGEENIAGEKWAERWRKLPMWRSRWEGTLIGMEWRSFSSPTRLAGSSRISVALSTRLTPNSKQSSVRWPLSPISLSFVLFTLCTGFRMGISVLILKMLDRLDN